MRFENPIHCFVLILVLSMETEFICSGYFVHTWNYYTIPLCYYFVYSHFMSVFSANELFGVYSLLNL